MFVKLKKEENFFKRLILNPLFYLFIFGLFFLNVLIEYITEGKAEIISFSKLIQLLSIIIFWFIIFYLFEYRTNLSFKNPREGSKIMIKMTAVLFVIFVILFTSSIMASDEIPAILSLFMGILMISIPITLILSLVLWIKSLIQKKKHTK